MTRSSGSIGGAGGDRRQRLARRILNAARRGIAPVAGVMATPPTVTQGTDFANSLISTAMTTNFGSGTYQANDARYVESVSGKIILSPSQLDRYVGQGMTGNNVTLAKRATYGQGLRFATDAMDMDICCNFAATTFCIYVTDPATGVRARTQAGDISFASSNWKYLRVTFATRAVRIIEIYCTNQGQFRGINVESGYTIWPAPLPDEPKVVILGDSWGNGQLSGGTNSVKLAWPTYLAERLGIANIYSSSNGGTGLLNPGGTNGTFRERVVAGDLNISLIGAQDLVVIETSVNDTSTYTDAACQTEMQLLTTAIMTVQPGALIAAFGPQTTLGTTTPQTRYDAIKAGFMAAAGTDQRLLWIDNSPAGEAWYASATRNAACIGADNTHPNDVGKILLGHRAGQSILAALSNRFG